MAKSVIMPVLGMSQDTGRLVKWLKQEGDRVEAGEALMEIETDKATVEIESTATGILQEVSATEGDLVPVGQTIALIAEPGEEVNEGENETEGKPSTLGESAEPVDRKPIAPVDSGVHGSLGRHPRIPASPKARRLAKELGIPLSSLRGSGPDGAIVGADIPHQSVSSSFATGGSSDHPRVIPSGDPRASAGSLDFGGPSAGAYFYLRREVDASGLLFWRNQIRERTKVQVTHIDMLIRFLTSCLNRYPHLNVSIGEEGVRFNSAANIAFTVLRESDAVSPVIHRADKLSFAEISIERARLSERAGQNALSSNEVEDATFTVNDVGLFDIDSFDSPVASPQVAGLAVGRLTKSLRSVNGKSEWNQVFQLTLSCNCRVVDGLRAAAFLRSLVELIEDPTKLLTYV
jgi:pyruvate dehydrogenase E2 component (dihydrolipoamide acetyltransferase)